MEVIKNIMPHLEALEEEPQVKVLGLVPQLNSQQEIQEEAQDTEMKAGVSFPVMELIVLVLVEVQVVKDMPLNLMDQIILAVGVMPLHPVV